MTLTGKCKKDFEKWYTKGNELDLEYIGQFYLYPLNMKYGVFVDFFDSVGIVISGLPYQLVINEGSIQRYKINYGGFERQHARTDSIEKSNEIYNENI